MTATGSEAEAAGIDGPELAPTRRPAQRAREEQPGQLPPLATTGRDAGRWPMIGPPSDEAREPFGIGPAVHRDLTGNRLLAARARDLADRAMAERKAWLSVSVALDTTRTVAAARAALEDVAEPVRGLARDYLGQLASSDDETEQR